VCASNRSDGSRDSSFVVLVFVDSLSLGSHFWPFTDVLREIWPAVTRKVGKARITQIAECRDGVSSSAVNLPPAYCRESAADTAASTIDLRYPRDLR